MNAGSTRVTVRLGDELLELIDEAIDRRNDGSGTLEAWNRTDFIIQAIQEKLNHGHRSARRERKVNVYKVDENTPRVVEES